MQYGREVSTVKVCENENILSGTVPSVAVMMSTYNGTTYIREQIDSILLQKNVDIDLYIRDDASSDSTVDIIKEYQCRHSNVFFEQGTNLGPGKSFMTLLCSVGRRQKQYDYYAFADQDDIWLCNKLSKAIEMLGGINAPALYCSNQLIYKNNSICGLRYDYIPDMTLKGHLSRNSFSGCTMVMNASLFKLIVFVGSPGDTFLKLRTHDAWIYLVAITAGKVVYDTNAYIYYRIHRDNVVGIRKYTGINWVRLVLHNIIHGKSTRHLRSMTAKKLLSSVPDLRKDDRDILLAFANYQNSFRDKLRLIFDREICVSGENRLLFILKVLTNYI